MTSRTSEAFLERGTRAGEVPRAAPGPRGLHVVLGAGPVGRALARALRGRGQGVRVVHRSAARLDLGGADEAFADLCSADDVEDVTEGAACVYDCARPGPVEWPPAMLWLRRGVLEGTRRNGVHLVVVDDLSAYGRAAAIGAATPLDPCSPGGRIRARAASLLLARESGRRRRVVVARAADFFGPDAGTETLFGERFLRRVLAGRAAPVYGNPELPHSYAYLPDVVRALVALGASPAAEGAYLLPVEPVEPTATVIGRFYDALGLTPAVAPRSSLVARLREFLRPGTEAIAERIFQWRQPLVVDDVRIRRDLGLTTTPWDVAVWRTVEWALGAYGRAKGAESCLRDG